MNVQTRNVALLGLVSAVALGLFAASGINPSALALVGTADNVRENAGFMGHITLTVYDKNGDIKQYLQTDNVIVNSGEDCTGQLLFSSNSASCGIGAGAFFNDIIIGTGASTATTLMTTLSVEVDEILNAAATETTVSAGGVSSHVTTITGSTTIAAVVAITEAGLHDSVSAELFARQQFSALNLNTDDTLTIDWVITIAGS